MHHTSSDIAGCGGRRAFTLVEVLVGLSIMTVGILGIMAVFPFTLRAREQAELRTIGAWAALMKIEEVRRDNDTGGKLLTGIENLSEPTEPVVFAFDQRLAYRFSSTTILYEQLDPSTGLPIDDPSDPRDDPGVARVIIQESPAFRPNPRILDEYRF